MNNKSADAQEVTSETLQFLTFAVGAEQYGISITTVREIKSWEETTVLPNSPQFMRGVINLRGTVVPIFDLRSRFGQGETEIDAAKSVVIVIAIEDRQIGLLVDAVSDILDVDSSDIKNAPSSAEVNIEEAYINGLVSAGNKMVILLNTSNLFDVELVHILIPLPRNISRAKADQTEDKAHEVYKALLAGANFEETAATESAGQNALEGGDLGWRKTSQLPTVFADKVKPMKVGEISEPIRSASGFHIIKLKDKRGGNSHMVQQTQVRHILIKPNEIRDQRAAYDTIVRIRNDILQGKPFEEMAKTYSEDPSSARKGGNLGWVNPGVLVPKFEQTMNQIAVESVSEPFLTQYGWHILEVLGRRDQNMGEEFRVNKARAFLQKRRYEEELQTWIREIRQEAYVKINL